MYNLHDRVSITIFVRTRSGERADYLVRLELVIMFYVNVNIPSDVMTRVKSVLVNIISTWHWPIHYWRHRLSLLIWLLNGDKLTNSCNISRASHTYWCIVGWYMTELGDTCNIFNCGVVVEQAAPVWFKKHVRSKRQTRY